MAKRTVQEVVEKQVQRTRDSVDEFRKGVDRVTESPMDKAADQLGKAKTNYIAAIDSGKTERRLRAVPLAKWKKSTLDKADRIGTGIEAARDKLTDFHAQRADFQDRLSTEITSMPNNTVADARARMLKQFDGMKKFVYIPKG